LLASFSFLSLVFPHSNATRKGSSPETKARGSLTLWIYCFPSSFEIANFFLGESCWFSVEIVMHYDRFVTMSRRGNTAHYPLAFDQLRAKLLQRWLQSNQSILSNNVQNNPNHAFLNTITVEDSAIRSFPDVSLLMKISHFNMINDITNTNTAKCCLTGTVGLSNWQCFDVATFKKSWMEDTNCFDESYSTLVDSLFIFMAM